jgi:hypothetical protein
MATQVVNGKGFEWAVATVAAERLLIPLQVGQEQPHAAVCFSKLSSAKQAHFRKCAEGAIAYVIEREKLPTGATGSVALSGDVAGEKGDVRDVLIVVNGRQIGVSCKTNHEAFKHPRLSGTIDFVRKWDLGGTCSEAYWTAVRPVFAELAEIRDSSKSTTTWASIEGYQERYYQPVLKAWREELLRIAGGTDVSSQQAATALAHYVIGKIDFWKVVASNSEVRLYSFNVNKTLGTKTTTLPNRIIGIDAIDGSQYSMTVHMNNGYQFNFRIHNAKSTVEPSLKFDVQAEGLPPQQIHQHTLDLR